MMFFLREERAGVLCLTLPLALQPLDFERVFRDKVKTVLVVMVLVKAVGMMDVIVEEMEVEVPEVEMMKVEVIWVK